MWRRSGRRVRLAAATDIWCAKVKSTCGGAVGQSVGVGRSPQWHGLRAVVGSRGRGLSVLVWCVGTNGLGELCSVRLAECVNGTRGAVGMCAGVRRIRRTWKSVGSADRTSKNVATAGSRGSRGDDRVCCWEGLRTLASMFAGAGGFRLAAGGSKKSRLASRVRRHERAAEWSARHAAAGSYYRQVGEARLPGQMERTELTSR